MPEAPNYFGLFRPLAQLIHPADKLVVVTADDPHQDNSARLREAERRIERHPGYQEYLLCLAFERSLTAVFIPNWKELLVLLDQVATDPSLALEMVQNVRPPDVREKFQSDTTQRLHNYVAGTMTLVEHS